MCFLAFDPEITFDKVSEHCLPSYEDYGRAFDGDVRAKHALSEIEIVAWDSSLTLFFSKNNDLATKFKNNLPASEYL